MLTAGNSSHIARSDRTVQQQHAVQGVEGSVWTSQNPQFLFRMPTIWESEITFLLHHDLVYTDQFDF